MLKSCDSPVEIWNLSLSDCHQTAPERRLMVRKSNCALRCALFQTGVLPSPADGIHQFLLQNCVWPAGENRSGSRQRVQYRFTCGESWRHKSVNQVDLVGRKTRRWIAQDWLTDSFKHFTQTWEKVSHLLQLPLLFSWNWISKSQIIKFYFIVSTFSVFSCWLFTRLLHLSQQSHTVLFIHC